MYYALKMIDVLHTAHSTHSCLSHGFRRRGAAAAARGRSVYFRECSMTIAKAEAVRRCMPSAHPAARFAYPVTATSNIAKHDKTI